MQTKAKTMPIEVLFEIELPVAGLPPTAPPNQRLMWKAASRAQVLHAVARAVDAWGIREQRCFLLRACCTRGLLLLMLLRFDSLALP